MMIAIRRGCAPGLSLWLFACVVAAQTRDVLLDRVLAIVSGEVITLSDVRAATTLGLVTPRAGGDPTARALSTLIERQLMLGEANRYAAPDPPSGAVERRLEEVRQHVSSTGDVEVTLRRTGMTAGRLRDFIRDDLRVDSYLDQRFGGAAQPTEEEVAAYYRAHQSQFAQEGLARFEQASALARDRLRDERRQVLVADWLERLRRRADIRELYLPSSS
ncbi:MAG: hypothetical protein HYS05_05840 [Acidobacteria bacterium]|nr:hypothetical protein [Acidobacteriota bacterium]